MSELEQIDSISKFCKPKGGGNTTTPTRHLYIAGLGHQLGTTKAQVYELFHQFGEIDDSINEFGVELLNDKRYCYLSFMDENSTENAIKYYQENNLKMLLKFAALIDEEPKLPGFIEPEDTLATDHIVVNGLRIIENFLSENEQEILMKSEIGDSNSIRWQELLSRRIQHYGLIFNYRTLMLDYTTEIPPIPEILNPFLLRAMDYIAETYDSTNDTQQPLPFLQMTVNEYKEGQGIASHIDTSTCLGPDILVVSLGSGVVMTFQER